MPQTPVQRRANLKYAKSEEEKRGKPIDATQKVQDRSKKPPVSKYWIAVLMFVMVGGLILELLRLFVS